MSSSAATSQKISPGPPFEQPLAQNCLLQEQVLSAWISLNALLKDSRVSKKMPYNEAVVMRIVLERFNADGVGRTPVQLIIKETQMLKSLVNRTINALCQQGYLEKQRDDRDGRSLFVLPVPEKLPDFLEVHQHSLSLVQNIIDIIGQEDAEHFVRICRKLSQGEVRLP